MAINGRALTGQQYEELRYILIKQLEGFTQTPYFDADYNPNANNGSGNHPLITIGVGFNIDGTGNNHVRTRVLNAVYPANRTAAEAVDYLIRTTAAEAQTVLNNPASTQQERDAAQRVLDRDVLRTTRIPTTSAAAAARARQQRNNALAALFDVAVNAATGGTVPAFTMTNAQIRAVFDGLMDTNDTVPNTTIVTWRCFEEKVNGEINGQTHPQTGITSADYTTPVISRSYERVVLASLAYNNPVLLGGRLSAAINAQRTTNGATDIEGLARDRAEAWYEIRYNSGDQYKRRVIESEVFGLYENAAAVTAADARGVYSVYTRHNREGNGRNSNYMNTAWDTAQNGAFTSPLKKG